MTAAEFMLFRWCLRDQSTGHEVVPGYVPVANALLKEGLVRYEMRGNGTIRYPVLYPTPEGKEAYEAERTRRLLAER